MAVSSTLMMRTGTDKARPYIMCLQGYAPGAGVRTALSIGAGFPKWEAGACVGTGGTERRQGEEEGRIGGEAEGFAKCAELDCTRADLRFSFFSFLLAVRIDSPLRTTSRAMR